MLVCTINNFLATFIAGLATLPVLFLAWRGWKLIRDIYTKA